MPGLSNPPAIIINYDEGGEVSKYEQRERAWEAKGRRIVVRGLCGSACTLYLKSPYLCAEPTAQFVFHASYFRYGKLGAAGDDPEGNSYMLQWYPARIKEFIASQGGLTTTPIYLEGRWTQQLVPAKDGLDALLLFRSCLQYPPSSCSLQPATSQASGAIT